LQSETSKPKSKQMHFKRDVTLEEGKTSQTTERIYKHGKKAGSIRFVSIFDLF